MQIKIYFDAKPVYLCDKLDSNLNELIHHPETIFIDELSAAAINSLLHEIKKENFLTGIILSPDFKTLAKTFFKHFIIIEAAGGLVQNENKDLLFIFRRGKWDLPKGKIEQGETAELCAQREIEEETGVIGLLYKKKIIETYHVYNEFGKEFLKISRWFYFTCSNKQQIKPQLEEDITEVKWIKTKEIAIPTANTYHNIKDVLGDFFDNP
ncbi:MAG: NUDIX domain-containing protein [Ferruginibacter sp.]